MGGQLLGFLNLNKPGGMTSHDVVNSVRRLTGTKHVGHGGTLDPMAEGVLPIAVGAACRLLNYLQTGKTYKAEILFGQRTTTDDTEGEILSQADEARLPDESSVQSCLSKFIGDLEQIPPMYSAVHHHGERLYSLARKGAVIEAVPARQVKVIRFDLLSFQHSETGLPVATARIDCGAGTYIRSLARDLGEMLGCGACLSGLVRERSGPFTLDNALTLEALESAVASDQLAGCITDPSKVIGGTPEFPHIAVNDEIGRRIFNGQKIDLNQLPPQFHAPEMSGAEKIFVTAGDWLLSVCRIDSGLLRSQVVINHGNETD